MIGLYYFPVSPIFFIGEKYLLAKDIIYYALFSALIYLIVYGKSTFILRVLFDLYLNSIFYKLAREDAI